MEGRGLDEQEESVCIVLTASGSSGYTHLRGCHLHATRYHFCLYAGFLFHSSFMCTNKVKCHRVCSRSVSRISIYGAGEYGTEIVESNIKTIHNVTGHNRLPVDVNQLSEIS